MLDNYYRYLILLVWQTNAYLSPRAPNWPQEIVSKKILKKIPAGVRKDNRMRCPECGIKQKKGSEPRCHCGYRFIFHANTGQGMTDAFFFRLLRRAGGNGRFHFTFPQLYTAWCQQDAEERFSLLRKKLAGIGVLLLTLCIACSLLFGWAGGLFSLLLLTGGPWILIRQYRRQLPPDLGDLKKLVKQWQSGNGDEDEMLLLHPSLDEPPPAFPEKDLFDYGAERIIIVERRLLVDLLVNNGFHADQNALIFSQDGYPSYIVHRAQKMLKEDKSLPVYLLHDASDGEMALSLKKKLSGRTVIDLGIGSDHLEKIQSLKALQLHRRGYKAPLDILPYPVLATICGQALSTQSTLSEVLEQWDARSVQQPLS
ncbi:MAG: hypothetical protein D3910_12495 [Candidatus Electrothrix sp. ATG2]|nr:hypothetical protein [Candidatus Electrothrix sp. ATG2]